MTNNLRKLIKAQLTQIANRVYYQNADDKALYPHIVFSLTSVNMVDVNRHDYVLDVNVWTKSEIEAEDLADSVENVLHMSNLPFADTLPTFYLENRRTVEDEDKSIKHVLVSFVVQTYKN